MENELDNSPQDKNILEALPDGLKIILFISLMLLFLIVSSMLGAIITAIIFGFPIFPFDGINTFISKDVNAEIVFQILSSIGLFVFPALVYAKHFEKNSAQFFKAAKKPDLKIVLFTIVIFFSANFALDLLVKLTHLIPFEEMESPLIAALLDIEKLTETSLKRFLVFTSPLKFILVFTAMALIPALGEELTFRGVFFNLFHRTSKNVWFAVLFSGAIFSLIHFQLHNFLAIFFMGALLAYVYHLTQNIWVSIIAHLFNNGLIVILSYANNLGFITYDFSEPEEIPIYISIFAAVLFAVLFYIYRKFILSQNPKSYE